MDLKVGVTDLMVQLGAEHGGEDGGWVRHLGSWQSKGRG